MPFTDFDSLRYYTFESLQTPRLAHGIFTRRGGVSPSPWDELNQGGTVGDTRDNVVENRRRMFQALGRPVESLYDVWQVHSAEVICTRQPRPLDAPHLKADAILTDQPGLTLFMRFADCVPILLYDPRRKAIGLVHAGWLGTVRQTARAALQAMVNEYHSAPGDILAAIGPSIGAHHYEVGPEVAARVQQVFGSQAASLLPCEEGAVKFDLWAANQLILEGCGVRRIEVAGICTACCTSDWYSHRAEHGKTGRFGALIGLI